MNLPAPPESGKFRVLVVEDDPGIARLILATLTRAGFECHYAPDGLEGWTSFRATDPHLVLSDLMMPGMDGQELCRKIRETSTIPLILMTAADSEEAQLQGFKSGADDYVAKPFNPKMMTARVIAHLRRVYRYDATELEASEARESPSRESTSHKNQNQGKAQEPSVPVGWGQCERCQYMGPSERFKTEMQDGDPVTVCPACGETQSITYSIG